MSKKYSDKNEFHYINPNYRKNVKGNSVNNNSNEALNKESQHVPKHNVNDEYELAFRGNCEILEKYNYVPYYDKKSKN